MSTAISQQKWRKSQGAQDKPLPPFQADVQEISNLIAQQQFESALKRLNGLLAVEDQINKKAQLLFLVGNLEVARKNYQGGIPYFEKASRTAGFESDLAIKAKAEIVRSYLAIGNASSARAVAEQAINLSRQNISDFKASLSFAKDALDTGHTAMIPKAPTDLGQTASAMGLAYEGAGDYEGAETFYKIGDATGSVPSCLGLARVAFKSGHKPEALQYAISALEKAKFKANSLSAIHLALASADPISVNSLAEKIDDGLKQATPSVADKGALETVKSLRLKGDDSWRERAQAWLAIREAQNPSVAAELRKLLVADARAHTDAPQNSLLLAQQLLQVPRLAPGEWLMAAKEVIRSTATLERPLDLEPLLVDGCARFGMQYHGQFAHGLGLACYAAGKFETANQAFERVLKISPPTDRQWAISAWALGRSLSAQNNLERAGKVWDQIVSNDNVSPKFRAYARLMWLDQFEGREDTALQDQNFKEIQSLVDQVTEISAMLLVARRLQLFPGRLHDLGAQCLDRAIDLSGLSTKTALEGVDIRNLRQISLIQRDYEKVSDIVTTWVRLRPFFQQATFQPKADFWVYATTVMSAYLRLGKPDEGRSMLNWIVENPRVSPTGSATAWCLFGDRLAKAGKKIEAFRLFKSALASNLVFPEMALPSYWLALEAYRTKDSVAFSHYSSRVLSILSKEPAFYWERATLVKTLLLNANLNLDNLPTRYVRYSSKFRVHCLAVINAELSRLA